MHAKTLIFDKRVVLTGSVNMTHNGFENNKEHLFRIDTPSTVLDVYEDFLETWGASQKVDQTMIDEMMVASENAKDKRRQKNVVRSLSAEIDREGRVPRQEGGRRS
jgi:phosphatidylserine/phosphatidylglycerophosphate/cardiolipin synthase-like enzyme